MHSKWGDRMSKAETLYNYIQYGGKKRIEEIVDQIMWELLPIIGPIQFPESISTNNTINKIYALLENGYYPYLAQALEKYGYDYNAELQFILMNIAYRESQLSFNQLLTFTKFPSLHGLETNGNRYCAKTKIGTITFYPITKCPNPRLKAFALQYHFHGYCHEAALNFIKRYPEYQAVTSLVPNQFGEQQYHSYIDDSGKIADLANNLYMDKEDFTLLMKPTVLNEVRGSELSYQEKTLTYEDLPETKETLLRLALHQQIKRL